MAPRPDKSSAKTKILNAALTIIRAKGYAATTVDDLCAASDLPEARTCERRGRAGKNVRRAVRYIGIYWIGLERSRPGALGGL